MSSFSISVLGATSFSLIAALLVITAFAKLVEKRRRASVYSDLYVRVRTWWVIILGLIVTLWAGVLAFGALMSGLGYISWREAGRLLPDRKDLFVRFGLAVTAPLCLILLVKQSVSAQLPYGGIGAVLTLLLIVWLSDTAQYAFGKCLGRTPILPRLSPGKTVEGTVLGLLMGSLIAAILLSVYLDLSITRGAGLAMALPLLGFAGDITVSTLKRRKGMKDTGTILPGHGGLLDRTDSLLFAAPVFLFVLMIPQ